LRQRNGGRAAVREGPPILLGAHGVEEDEIDGHEEEHGCGVAGPGLLRRTGKKRALH
jgi:hypothetical protein